MVVAALLTGASRAAVATIAVRGQMAMNIVEVAFQTAGSGAIRPGQVRYGTWHGGDQSGVGESIVVSRNDDCEVDQAVTESCEIHCHGGAVAANRILDDLKRLGAVVADPVNWVYDQALPSQDVTLLGPPNHQHLLLAEAAEVLSQAVSVRTAAIALDQVRGAMTRFVSESLLGLPESDAHDAALGDIADQAKRMLCFAPLGLHLSTPWRVVLAGPPNVGKSSLINALVGYRRSITVDMPGTTRDVLEAQTVIDGWPVRLSDTAGIRDNAECAIETAGIESARRELEDADLIVWVEDASMSSTHATEDVSKLSDKPTIRVLNKIDRASGLENFVLQEGSKTAPRIKTSAMLGIGIDELRQAISKALVPEVPIAGSPVPVTSRQVAWLQTVADRSAIRNQSPRLTDGAVSDN